MHSIRSLWLRNPKDATLLGKALQLAPRASMFWEPDKKGKYKTKKKVKIFSKDTVKEGLHIMEEEIRKCKNECVTALKADSLWPVYHGDYEILWKFSEEKSVKEWNLTTDADHNEGKSKAEFVLGPHKKGVFRGYLDTDVPRDGVVKQAGYCTIRSPPRMLSFMRERPYDMSDFNHFLIRLRGDGRNYHIVLQMDRYFDVQWHDTYQYPLFTRGGPYWQTAKIPFSKFFHAAKGRIQDKQGAIDSQNVKTFAITVADGNKGPFQLEIDYIGLIQDDSHTQEFAYEMYEVDPYLLC